MTSSLDTVVQPGRHIKVTPWQAMNLATVGFGHWASNFASMLCPHPLGSPSISRAACLGHRELEHLGVLGPPEQLPPYDRPGQAREALPLSWVETTQRPASFSGTPHGVRQKPPCICSSHQLSRAGLCLFPAHPSSPPPVPPPPLPQPARGHSDAHLRSASGKPGLTQGCPGKSGAKDDASLCICGSKCLLGWGWG